MHAILLATLADRFGVETADAADIIRTAGYEVLPDDDGDLFALEEEATSALFAAGKYPLIIGADAAAPPITFGITDEGSTDDAD